MVRGLFIRRIFIWLDLALGALLLLTLGMILKGILLGAAPTAGQAPPLDELALQTARNLNVVQGRGDYDIIIQSDLFGPAGNIDPAAPPPPEPEPAVDDSIAETPLNLRLIGTTATSPTDRFASAIIADQDQRGAVGSYRIGDAVVENVFLDEVYARYVLILNKREDPPQRQRLSMDDEEKVSAVLAARGAQTGQPAPPGGDTAPETVAVNRQELLQEVYMNYADLVGKVRPRMVRDENGQIAGVTADNIGDIPIAQRLGITNGDVLQTVNNERIDSEQKIMEMVQKYQNSQTIRIGIMRNGKPKTITYRME